VYCNRSCLWVCLFVCLFVCLCLCMCGSVTTITRNCVHRSSPNWVCRWKYLQLIKFWPSCAPGKGSAAGRKFLAAPYYSQRAVFTSLWALLCWWSCVFWFYKRIRCGKSFEAYLPNECLWYRWKTVVISVTSVLFYPKELQALLSGVSQGSVLGLLLFLLFINNITDLFPDNVSVELFADDVTII